MSECVEQWGVFESVFTGPRTGNPFTEVELHSVFLRIEIRNAILLR